MNYQIEYNIVIELIMISIKKLLEVLLSFSKKLFKETKVFQRGSTTLIQYKFRIITANCKTYYITIVAYFLGTA